MEQNPGQGSSSKGIFSTPFGNAVSGDNPISSDGTPKPYDYGNATNGFETPGGSYSGGGAGGGIIDGPGTATGTDKR